MSSDFIAAGDQSGCGALSNAAMPVTCGVAMEVPDLKVKPRYDGELLGMVAAKILTPGAATSGYGKHTMHDLQNEPC